MATPAVLVDKRRPVLSLIRMFRPYRGSMLLATLVFIVKDSPIWILPILTGNIIDVVVEHKPLEQLWLNAGVAAVILLMNYPLNLVYVSLFSNAVRHVAADLRNGMTSRLQLLTIGFHSRTSASVIQSKVVRDAENVELALGQSYGVGLSAICVLVGALVSTAIRIPAFVLVFVVIVPIAAVLLFLLRRRSGSLNESLRHEIETFSSRVGEMAALMPITRAHALEDVALEQGFDQRGKRAFRCRHTRQVQRPLRFDHLDLVPEPRRVLPGGGRFRSAHSPDSRSRRARSCC